ncbi:fungal-specific transcription factor domain-containing protein [Whalleya microplaca]|nr:fungal-specific transcription factor domain-containing protein [Whalleya microplaca]
MEAAAAPPQPGTSTSGSSSTTAPAENATAAVRPQARLLSCTNCRARKLKCSRQHPCYHCVRSGAQCVFPSRKRIQKPRKTKNSELLQRLNRLESIVGNVGLSDLDRGGASSSRFPGSDPAAPKIHPLLERARGLGMDDGQGGSSGGGGGGMSSRQRVLQDSTTSKYISGEFWSHLCGEVEGLKQALEQSTDSDDDEQGQPSQEVSPESANDASSTSLSPSMLLGGSPRLAYERIEHPPPEHIRYLTSIFFRNVDLLLKILHRPTITTALHDLASSTSSSRPQLPPARSALFFAIYFAAVTSLSPEACLTHLSTPRTDLLQLFQAALEHSLTQADYLNSDNLETLQALTLYVATLRATPQGARSRASWALVALPIRLAQALNLHRDGAGARFPPLEAELRRRLWWQLIVLDIRASEDRGTTTVVARDSYDTRLPLNVNDEDFAPGGVAQPVERRGPTDATFSLCTAQSSGIFLYLAHAQRTGRDGGVGGGGGGSGGGGGVCAGGGSGGGNAAASEEEETVAHAQHLEAQFVTNADPAHAGSYLASVTVRVIVLKLWLVMQYPLHPRACRTALPAAASAAATAAGGSNSNDGSGGVGGGGEGPPTATAAPPRHGVVSREATLRTAVSVMELNEYAQSGPYSERFRWWALTYPQWHPLAVTLAELCMQTRGELVERAWRVVEDVFPRWSETIADTKSGNLWRPIRKLYKKAKAARAAATGIGMGTRETKATMPATVTGDAEAEGDVEMKTSPETALPTVGDTTVQQEVPFGTEGGAFEEPSMPQDLDKLTMSPNVFNEVFSAWPDVSFDIPSDIGGLGSMDWTTWDEFVNETRAEEQSGSSDTSYQQMM